MEQPTRYQRLVAAAKKNIREVSPAHAKAEADRGDALLVDVRETEEWESARVPGAKHLSRGVIEVEIEHAIADMGQSIICYCGAGGRSALAVESLQKMGYKNVRSLAGGFKAWQQAGLPTA